MKSKWTDRRTEGKQWKNELNMSIVQTIRDEWEGRKWEKKKERQKGENAKMKWERKRKSKKSEKNVAI